MDHGYAFTGGLWLVTGAAGFIGANIVEELLLRGQKVRGLDNFSTGKRCNIESIRLTVGPDLARNLEFIEGDIRDRQSCVDVMRDVSYVLHQAGLGSVPRSLDDPLTTNEVNVGGFLNILDAARRAGVRSFVYAASSSTYGDETSLPKVESRIGEPLSPYAVSKLVNEIYAKNFKVSYGFRATGLRYFNVFGPRQDPDGAYAAVIPKWTASMIKNEDVEIFGDGLTSRDFCFVANAVQANLRAALAPSESQGEVYNVAYGQRTSLRDLFEMLKQELSRLQIHYSKEPVYRDFRRGDVRHSLADISKAEQRIGYKPRFSVRAGLRVSVPWYVAQYKSAQSAEGTQGA